MVSFRLENKLVLGWSLRNFTLKKMQLIVKKMTSVNGLKNDSR